MKGNLEDRNKIQEIPLLILYTELLQTYHKIVNAWHGCLF